MTSYKKTNREYFEYYECTDAKSRQSITTNGQKNGQTSSTNEQASTTSRKMSTANGEMVKRVLRVTKRIVQVLCKYSAIITTLY